MKNRNFLIKLNENKLKNLITFFVRINQNYLRNSGPYITYEEMRRKQEREDRKKWVDPFGFISSVNKYSKEDHFIPNYVSLSPSNPPINYSFRDIKKIKWISEQGFVQ